MEGESGVEESRAHFRHPPKLPTASADVDVDNDDYDDDDGGSDNFLLLSFASLFSSSPSWKRSCANHCQ